MPLIERLRKQASVIHIAAEESCADDVADALRKAADEIERLRRIEDAARMLKFSLYPAHGSGFVLTVTGNVDSLNNALGNEGTEIVPAFLSAG